MAPILCVCWKLTCFMLGEKQLCFSSVLITQSKSTLYLILFFIFVNYISASIFVV